MFPIQAERGAKPHPMKIPWSVAERAYSVYAARYGKGQSLERMAERGGFGPGEMDMFLPGWREECSEIAQLRTALAIAEHYIRYGDGQAQDLNGMVVRSREREPVDSRPTRGEALRALDSYRDGGAMRAVRLQALKEAAELA